MAFYVGKGMDALAEACNPEGMPHGVTEKYANDEVMAGIRELQETLDDFATITNHGRQVAGDGDAKFVASIPAPALLLALHMEPDLLYDKEKFYRWFNKTKYAPRR